MREMKGYFLMRSVILLILLALAFGGCVAEAPVQKDPLREAPNTTLMSFDEIKTSQEVHRLSSLYAISRLRLAPQQMAKFILRDFATDSQEPLEFKLPEAQVYLAFMKAQVRKWERGEMNWEAADHSIVARGAEIRQKMQEESNAEDLQSARPGEWGLLWAPRSPLGLWHPSRPLSEWNFISSWNTEKDCDEWRTVMEKGFADALKNPRADAPFKEIDRENLLNVRRIVRCLPIDWVAPLLLK